MIAYTVHPAYFSFRTSILYTIIHVVRLRYGNVLLTTTVRTRISKSPYILTPYAMGVPLSVGT